MQIRLHFLILHQNIILKQIFVLSNIEEIELHDRWLSEFWVALIALSNVLHAADELIGDQIMINENSRFLDTFEPEL